MGKLLDLLIIKPGSQKKIYGVLSHSLTGLEPPLWAALLAAFVRDKGFQVQIIDAEIEAENILPRIQQYQPRYITLVVSGTNPSASTMNMVGVRALLEEINNVKINSKTILVGLHPSALPKRSIEEEAVDFVCEGEGFLTLSELLLGLPLKDIRGLWYRDGRKILSNSRAGLVDPKILPMPAWDLLPMGKYRAHNWHCFGHLDERSPYGVIYTSLGCPFYCSFCCINALFDQHTIRYRPPQKVIEEIDFLVKDYSIKNIKIIDEMFDLNEKHVMDICDLIIERDYDLNIWAYARVDTINERKLEKMKKAGIRWLGIGFEAGNDAVRQKASKGRFDNTRILKTADLLRRYGVNIGGNFIFGLPDDTIETMQQSLDLAKEINCEYANFYVAMAYPGSKLYEEAVAKHMPLPDSWSGYSQFSYETLPLPTRYLTPQEILRFRDNAFLEYYSTPRYQNMILEKFGQQTLDHIREMLTFRLKRKILGD